MRVVLTVLLAGFALLTPVSSAEAVPAEDGHCLTGTLVDGIVCVNVGPQYFDTCVWTNAFSTPIYVGIDPSCLGDPPAGDCLTGTAVDEVVCVDIGPQTFACIWTNVFSTPIYIGIDPACLLGDGECASGTVVDQVACVKNGEEACVSTNPGGLPVVTVSPQRCIGR